jgi:hypothetical protein
MDRSARSGAKQRSSVIHYLQRRAYNDLVLNGIGIGIGIGIGRPDPVAGQLGLAARDALVLAQAPRGARTPTRLSGVTSPASRSALHPSVPAGRSGSTIQR